MRFTLSLNIDKNAYGNRIPFNYQYEMSAVIYKILSKSDVEFSTWLHDNGFIADKKQFKLFTFSRLKIPEYLVQGSFMKIISHTVEWHISFLPENSTQKFIQGLFQDQTFEIGNREAKIKCNVQNVSLIPAPVFHETMSFETLSPICIPLKRTDGTSEYIAPNHPQANELIKQNLLSKYLALNGKKYAETDFTFNIDTTSTPKPVLITIKAGTPEESKLKGFLCNFILTAPQDLMKIMYEAGVGSKNSLGFGMVKIKD